MLSTHPDRNFTVRYYSALLRRTDSAHLLQELGTIERFTTLILEQREAVRNPSNCIIS